MKPRPMRRRIVQTGLVLLSTLSSVAVLVGWARSLGVADWLSHARGIEVDGRYARREWIAISGHGFVNVTRRDLVPIDDAAAALMSDRDRNSHWRFGPVESYPRTWSAFVEGLGRLGFDRHVDPRSPWTLHSTTASVPHWLILYIVSVPSQFALRRWIKARRAARRAGFAVEPPAVHPGG